MIFVCFGLLCQKTFAETERTTIFFHSSETNINNFKSLKIKFDRYLLKHGAYEFQPIKNRVAFENCIKTRENSLLLLSSWHYSIIYKDHTLIPILVGSRKGKKTQKRILVTRKNVLQRQPTRKNLASASSEHYTRTVLSKMDRVSNLSILTVPKDIDALFAVGFGVCEFALTTEHAFKKLRVLNPLLYKTMKIMDSCEESYLLIIAVPKSMNTILEDLCKVIKEMWKDPEGKKNLHMLGLDNWQSVTSFDRSKLEKESANILLRVKE